MVIQLPTQGVETQPQAIDSALQIKMILTAFTLARLSPTIAHFTHSNNVIANKAEKSI